MASEPLVSLILCVKNGMPYLPEAVASTAAQKYSNFELIIQDGGSTDGTLEYLHSVSGIPKIQIESGKDGGIGDAYNRALNRCSGEFIGTIDADNLLAPNAITSAVKIFREHPECAAIYGANEVIDGEGRAVLMFQAGSFDRIRLMRCDLVPPFASAFFSRKVCGEELYFDSTLKTCADFDLWLRISHLPIHTTTELIARTRLSANSMTCNVDRYDQFCRDKLTALERFVKRGSDSLTAETSFKLCAAGVYFWAAESMANMGDLTDRFQKFCRMAAEYDTSFDRWKRLLANATDRQMRLTLLTFDLNRNLTKEGRRTFVTRLRVAAKFLLGRYDV